MAAEAPAGRGRGPGSENEDLEGDVGREHDHEERDPHREDPLGPVHLRHLAPLGRKVAPRLPRPAASHVSPWATPTFSVFSQRISAPRASRQ